MLSLIYRTSFGADALEQCVVQKRDQISFLREIESQSLLDLYAVPLL